MSSDEIIKIADLEILFRKSTRAKHILLRQNTKGAVVLICPKWCPKPIALAFAKRQEAWIRAHLQYAPQERVFRAGDTVMILGREYRLEHGKRTALKEDVLTLSGEADFFHRRVCSYAQKMLAEVLHQKAHELGKRLGVKIGRITLRNTSSRWGSCSSGGNLSFCWKVAFAPMEVVDYLVAHEVAHLKQMNHSDKFWRLVDELTDKRAFAEKWIKKNGRALQAIK